MAESTLNTRLREFPVTVVTGLRQSGKTTLVRRAGTPRTYVTLDDLGPLAFARRDPEGFLRQLPRPVTIDEAQRVPELLLPIKREIDRRPKAGQFLLTGSSRIELRQGVRETLAGRAALLRLRPMTWSEAAGHADRNPVDELFSCRTARDVSAGFARGLSLDGDRVLGGGLPVPLLKRTGPARRRWFEHYRAAYVERDVPPLLRVENLSGFVRFTTLLATRTAQTTNYAALAHEAGISADTGLRWFGVIEATFLADLIPPYWKNLGKRLVKSPKLHFGDAGLAAHMAGVRGWTDATRQNLAGPLLETLVAQHLLAFSECARRETSLFHYRTHAGAEVDFVLARGSRLLPIEVKSGTGLRSTDVRGMASFLQDFKGSAPFGVVLHGGTETHPVARNIVAIPVTSLLDPR